MKKEYWKIGLAAAFLAVAGFCYGQTRWQQGTLLPAETKETILTDWETEGAVNPPESDRSKSGSSEINPPKSNPSENAETKGADCYVHVCGEVAEPGVYVLAADSRIFEAIEAAGGFTEEAARDVLNLAGKIHDGMQIIVLSKEEAKSLPTILEEGNGEIKSERVNLNTATKEELMTLKGIGESKAEDIIRYREESGGFLTIEDIMKVPGIKEAGFQKIRDSITV